MQGYCSEAVAEEAAAVVVVADAAASFSVQLMCGQRAKIESQAVEALNDRMFNNCTVLSFSQQQKSSQKEKPSIVESVWNKHKELHPEHSSWAEFRKHLSHYESMPP